MSTCIATDVVGLRCLLEHAEPAGSACIAPPTAELQVVQAQAETAP